MIPPGLLDRLRVLPAFLERAAAQVSDADARQSGAAGGFSLVEHACHLRDYDREGCLDRVGRMLTEENPFLPDFQGEERNYRGQDLAEAIRGFARNRDRSLRLAERLSDAELARIGRLGSIGVVTIQRLLEVVAEHDETHRREIEELLGELAVSALQRMAREFAEGFNSGDVDRMMRGYGETYVDVNLRQPIQSHDERRAYFARLMERGGVRLAVRPDEIVVEGAIAFVRGRVDMLPTDAVSDGGSARELRYIEIARRSADGSWKAVWGMDGPVQDPVT